jgi:lipid-A-disaccharide synthase
MRVFFSVGEPSGDLHGANLIRDLQARHPQLQCVGYGGPRMQAAGCELHFDLTSLAVMWIGRVLLNLRTFFRLRDQAAAYFDRERPDAVVLIDYPGFNWHIAAAAKQRGIPVFYYGVPQLWAWAPWRVKKMARTVDHALCKLPFEERWYRERGVNATFVGHPYFDEMQRQQLDDVFLAEQRKLPGRLVTILPGSRTQEVTSNLPAFLKAAALIRQQAPDVRFAIAAFNQKQANLAAQLVERSGLTTHHSPRGLEIPIHLGRTPELMHLAESCLACSGSVSLELLWHEKPTVIHYRVSPWLYAAGRYLLMTVRYITLVNLLAVADPFAAIRRPYDACEPGAEQIPFPEYPTWQDKSAQLAKHIIHWLSDEPARQRQIAQLRTLKSQYAQPGASQRAAEYILEQLSAPSTRRAAA